MSAPYFTLQDHLQLSQQPVTEAASSFAKCTELHRTLARRVRELSWDIHPIWERPQVLCGRSATIEAPVPAISMPFLRSRDQAVMVERMMGRDGVSAPASVDWHRHPVLEVRVMPEHLAVELVLPPTAWWDQRNLTGKLSIQRHRDTLRALITRMDGEFRFGFWQGSALSDTSLPHRQILRANALLDLLGTFGDGQDWLRMGIWYEPEDARLTEATAATEIVTAMAALFPVYAFLLWTSNNNFQSFHPTNTNPFNGREAQA